jgi:manganese-dependent inorganic pyrophosphatase
LADCKDYEEDGHVFSVSQIEELGFSHFYEKQKELFEALEAYRSKQASYFAALSVTGVAVHALAVGPCHSPALEASGLIHSP